MALVSQTVKNIVSGISQQPAILRFPEQLQEQMNGMSSGPAGLQKRPPTLHIATLDSSAMVGGINPLIHFVNRDENERYAMMFNGQGVKVWSLDGAPKTVTYDTGAQSYLTSSNPREELKVVTIADYTFIANSTKPVAMSSAVVSNVWSTQGALFHVKNGQYGRTYRLYVDGVQIASYTTPDGSTSSDTTKIDTNYIASQLQGNLSSGYYVESSGEGWLYVKKTSGTISSVGTKDGFNNQALFGFLRSTQKFSNLPATAPDGFTVLVQGETGSSSDDYYVRYDAANSVWKETAKPGILKSFDASTMPHVLVRNADGTFTFKTATWDDREIGDDDSNPQPSFVGQKINDICFIRNRLGFLAGENVILSKSGEFFKFWMSTATDVLDTDMIDDAVPDESIAILRHAVPFNEELLLFSSNAQFIGKSDSVFSPKSFRIDRTTKFDCQPHCRPVPAGRRVYFPMARAEYASLMEYYIVEDVTNVKDAHDISSHVPSLTPNTVHQILGSTPENLLLLLTSGAPNRIYVYKYLFQDEERVQASWSYWEFDSANILGGGFIGSSLYLMIARNGNLFLEKMLFTYETKDYTAELYRAFLDRKMIYTVPSGAYNVLTDATTINLQSAYSASLPASVSYGVLTSDGFYKVFPSAETVEMPGDLTGQQVVLGEVIQFKAILSEIMIKSDDGKGGIKAKNEGRLQLRSFWINYSNSGYFKITVEHAGKQTYEYEMTARLLGSNANTLGSLPIETGKFIVPIQGDSREVTITVESDTPSPLALVGFGWEGNYVERSGRG